MFPTKKPKDRGRSKRKTERKRGGIEINNNNNCKHRKKRKPNRSHREEYPDNTDNEIRRKLKSKRKVRNRKSAKESRERRKDQEIYLNHRIPKGLALKALLKSVNTNSTETEDNESLELAEMKEILDQITDNAAKEYTDYDEVVRDKQQISDNILCQILNEYININTSNDSEDSDLNLETDDNPIYLKVIDQFQDEMKLQIDDIPESIKPNSCNPYYEKGRKRKTKTKKTKKSNPISTTSKKTKSTTNNTNNTNNKCKTPEIDNNYIISDAVDSDIQLSSSVNNESDDDSDDDMNELHLSPCVFEPEINDNNSPNQLLLATLKSVDVALPITKELETPILSIPFPSPTTSVITQSMNTCFNNNNIYQFNQYYGAYPISTNNPYQEQENEWKQWQEFKEWKQFEKYKKWKDQQRRLDVMKHGDIRNNGIRNNLWNQCQSNQERRAGDIALNTNSTQYMNDDCF